VFWQNRIQVLFYLVILFFLFECRDGSKKQDAYTLVRINATEFKYEMPHEAAIFKFANDEFSIGGYVDSANTGIDFPSFGTGKLHLDKKINGDPIIK
jgi:hypothetical protein